MGRANKFQYGGEWCVRTPEGKALNLNSEEAADIILALWAQIFELEKKPKRQYRRKNQEPQQETV